MPYVLSPSLLLTAGGGGGSGPTLTVHPASLCLSCDFGIGRRATALYVMLASPPVSCTVPSRVRISHRNPVPGVVTDIVITTAARCTSPQSVPPEPPKRTQNPVLSLGMRYSIIGNVPIALA